MFSTYGSSLITIPIIAILEIFAVAKAFGKFVNVRVLFILIIENIF